MHVHTIVVAEFKCGFWIMYTMRWCRKGNIKLCEDRNEKILSTGAREKVEGELENAYEEW